MMSKTLVTNRDVERSHLAEPTKYIVRCCELRKRRMIRTASVSLRPRIRLNVER